MSEPTRLDLLALDIDVRLTTRVREGERPLTEIAREWLGDDVDEERVRGLMWLLRCAYALGYEDANRDPPGELYRAHGYRHPAERRG